jgi:hypothetical protein
MQTSETACRARYISTPRGSLPAIFGDVVAVEGDPLADINVAINNVHWVMKAGAVVVDKTKAQVR